VADAAPADPPPITLSATTSDAIVSGHSVGCLTIEGDYHRENHYYRVFDLASFGVTGGLAVQRVDVGIEVSVAGSGGRQPATLNLYELAGAFDLANLLAIGTASMDVPDLNGTLYQVPVTGAVAAGRSLVVELVTPDGLSAQNVLIVGSNAAGERGPTLIAAQECGLTTPTATNDSSIGRADMHWVVRAHGLATP
jgi:hypothetical protein